MFHILLLATVSVALAADAVKPEVQQPVLQAEVQPELKQAESASPILVHDDKRRYGFEDGLELIRHRGEQERKQLNSYRDSLRNNRFDDRRSAPKLDFKDDDHSGPVILRSPDPLPSHGHPDIERQNKIIADVYSPDYYQPTWILDYRYLKSGGRDYTRSVGGQILILPKNVRTNEHKEFSDFDSLLEHLRLSRLSEHSARHGGYGDEHEARRPHQNYGHDGRGQQHNWWRNNRHH